MVCVYLSEKVAVARVAAEGEVTVGEMFVEDHCAVRLESPKGACERNQNPD